MNKFGRNDPCPCGSGKKYKHCCLRRDRRERRTPTSRASAAPVSTSAAPQSLKEEGIASLDTMQQMARQLASQADPEERQAWQRILDTAEALEAYEEHQAEIEAASEELESYRDAFQDLIGDLSVAMDRAYQLFSGEQFVSFRYTVEDVHDAFERVGYPRIYREEPDQEDMEILFAAAVSLVDEHDRLRLARQLLLFLPEYVAAGRYMDAWMIQLSAIQMLDAPDRSNPFLTAMFFMAFEEWQEQLQEQRGEMLQKLGVDPTALEGMTGDELAAWFDARAGDFEEDQAEAYYQQYGMLREQTEADVHAMAQDAVTLLERDDAQHLYLASEEVEPWILEFMDRQAPFIEQIRAAAAEGRQPHNTTIQEMQREMIEVVGDMAEALFTPERKRQLAEDLTAYQRHLLSSGEREAAMLIYAAAAEIQYAEHPPFFFVILCHHTLRHGLEAAAAERDRRDRA